MVELIYEHARADKSDFLYAFELYHPVHDLDVWVMVDTKIAMEWGF
jgi:hypothetical protein